MNQLKTLIHLHTDYSYDSDISLDTLASYVDDNGIGCIAITDHDTIDGAKRFRHMTDAKVIVGEEISTRDGHLIGLFLKDCVPPGLSARATAQAIRDQGGLVFLPHPFVRAFSCGMGDHARTIVDLVDAVEVNNAQNALRRPDRLADRFADEFRIAKYVGSDSHMSVSIGPCYQMISEFESPASFLESVRGAELRPGRHPLAYFAATGYRLVRHYAGLSLAGGFGTNHSPQPRVTPQLATVRATR